MRSALHDLANTLSGIRGVLELSDPERPLSRRDRLRLEAVLSEGMSTLERSRHLAMETLPSADSEPGLEWRAGLEIGLNPLAVVFRSNFHLHHQGSPNLDHWPGDRLRGYILAVTRQLLPYAQGSEIELIFEADASEWIIHWSPITTLPESLDGNVQGRSRDISSRWALKVGAALGVALSFNEEAQKVSARVPRS